MLGNETLNLVDAGRLAYVLLYLAGVRATRVYCARAQMTTHGRHRRR